MAALGTVDLGDHRRSLGDLTNGVGATTGLMTIVSLPRPFVFHMSGDDPHPMPWIRVRLSCAVGAALYPDPQWQQLGDLWTALYPLEHLTPAQRTAIAALERTMPEFVASCSSIGRRCSAAARLARRCAAATARRSSCAAVIAAGTTVPRDARGAAFAGVGRPRAGTGGRIDHAGARKPPDRRAPDVLGAPPGTAHKRVRRCSLTGRRAIAAG